MCSLLKAHLWSSWTSLRTFSIWSRLDSTCKECDLYNSINSNEQWAWQTLWLINNSASTVRGKQLSHHQNLSTKWSWSSEQKLCTFYAKGEHCLTDKTDSHDNFIPYIRKLKSVRTIYKHACCLSFLFIASKVIYSCQSASKLLHADCDNLNSWLSWPLEKYPNAWPVTQSEIGSLLKVTWTRGV